MYVIPRTPLVVAFVATAAMSYWVWLFMDWGSYSHGGTAAGRIVIDSVLVIAVFLGVEVVRTHTVLPVRVASGIVVVPLGLFAVGSIAYAIRYLFAV